MTRLAAAFLVAILSLAGTASAASDPTAEHKRVYQEVNGSLSGMEQQAFDLDITDALAPAEATIWKDEGRVRKLRIVYPGDHGDTTQEFYYEADASTAPLFVYERIETQAVDGSNASSRENRYYFHDGKMFRWLDGDRQQVSPKSEDFGRTEQDLLDTAEAALAAAGGDEGGKQPVATTDAQESMGTFTGIEQGDYTYLKLEVDGEERSFMILDTDAAIEKLLDNPDAYVGKEISVSWQTSEEDIPEAGGKTEVDKVLTVTLPN